MFFKLIFCFREIWKKIRCRQIIIFFQPFFLFLGPMHIQEARNNVFQITFLVAGNSEKNIFAVGKLFYFSCFFLISKDLHPGVFYSDNTPTFFSEKCFQSLDPIIKVGAEGGKFYMKVTNVSICNFVRVCRVWNFKV